MDYDYHFRLKCFHFPPELFRSLFFYLNFVFSILQLHRNKKSNPILLHTFSMIPSSTSSSLSDKSHHDPKLARRWMTFLAKHETSRDLFAHASLLHIPFVGSHDAGTFGIVSNSELAADLPEILKKLPQFLNVTARRHIATWSKCQHFNLFEQLDFFGARYFDLRVCPHVDEARRNEQTGEIIEVIKESLWLTHGSFSVPLQEGLDQIRAFLDGEKSWKNEKNKMENTTKKNDDEKQQPNDDDEDENLEVFVLDLQRITGFTSAEQYRTLHRQFQTTLGKYMIPRQCPLSTPLKTIWENGWRVFVLVQEQAIPNLEKSLKEDNPVTEIIKHKSQTADEEDAAAENCLQNLSSSSSSLSSPTTEENIVSSSPTNLEVTSAFAEEIFSHPHPLFASSLSANNASSTGHLYKQSHPLSSPSSVFHSRTALSIRSRWFNKRYKEDLFPRLQLELQQRSRSHPGERFQLHILQGIFTPNATDMLWSFGTGQSGYAADEKEVERFKTLTSACEKTEFTGRHSIWDFAKQINTDVITLWEDESIWFNDEKGSDGVKNSSSVFVYRTVEDLKRTASETTFSSRVGFDPRNVLMIDFMEVGRSRKTGRNCFQVCFDLACTRFGLEPRFHQGK